MSAKLSKLNFFLCIRWSFGITILCSESLPPSQALVSRALICVLSDSLYWMVQRFFLLTIIWIYLSSLYTLTPSPFLEALCEQVYQNGCETRLHLWSLGVLEIAWDPWKSTCNKVRAPSGMKHRKLKHTCSFIVEIH